MRLIHRFIVLLSAIAFAAPAHSQGPVNLAPIVDLSRSADPSYFLTHNGSLLGPVGNSVVKVRFTGKHPCWLYQIAQPPENWSGANMALMTLTNYESFPVTVWAIFSSSSNPGDLRSSFQAPATLAAGQTTRFGFVFALPDPMQEGLRVLPPPPGSPTAPVYSQSQLDTSRVGHWRLSYLGTSPATIGMSEFSLATYNPGLPHLVDQWFQWNGRDWTNKIHGPSDFKARLADETTDLALNPGTGEVNGSSRLPNQGAGSNWRIANHAGKMYMVHPSGKLFWMFGLNGVHDSYGTMVSNRSQMFDALPNRTGAYGSLYIDHQASTGASGLDFLCQRFNLMQKYGRSYRQPYVAQLKRRLPSWGFNTVGAWSFDGVNDGSMPFTVALSTNLFPQRLKTPSITWNPLPDPYASGFQDWMTKSFTQALAPYKGKQNLAGVFVDNEMSWGSVSSQDSRGTATCALSALASASIQPARVAFLNQLKSEYGTIASLNKAWATAYGSFDSMTPPKGWASGLSSAAAKDCASFERAFALTYFSNVRSALQNAGLKGLYLGCRFFTSNDSVVSAAGQVVDVLSFNHYGTADTYPWAYYNSLPKPVLLSESSVGENNEGNFAGNPLASDPVQRAQWAYAILATAASQPNVVGVDWFNLTDWAATGDGDSMSNYGYGVVDVCDTPHYPLVNAFRTFAKQLYGLRG